jgi:DHA1 family inner membrane transport protein
MTSPKRTEPRLPITLAAMLLARITLNIVYRITYPFLPVIARGLGVDLTSVGLLVTARAAGGFTSPLFGPLSDAWGRKRLLLAGVAFLIVGAAICAALPFYAAFLVAFVTFGFAKAIFDPTMQAYIGDRVPYERRGRVMGITEFSWSAAWLLGVPSTGWLIARTGWQSPFTLLAVLGAAGLLLIAWLLPRDAPTVSHNSNTFQLGAVIRNRNVMATFCVGFLIILANEVMFIVYGAWMESRFGLSVVALGLASIVIGVAEAAGEFGSAAFVDRLGKRRAVLIGLVISAFTYGALPMLGQRLAWAMGGLVLLFVAFEFTIVSLLPLISELAPSARATTMSANIAAMTLARMIGSISGTTLFVQWGRLEANAIVSVVASALAFGVLGLFVREHPHPDLSASLLDKGGDDGPLPLSATGEAARMGAKDSL